MDKEKKYPVTVCLECLEEARKDTEKRTGRTLNWNGAYSTYVMECDVCGDIKECTEPRDVDFPDFECVYQRLRAKKIDKIINKK